jgi:hypothetical protein
MLELAASTAVSAEVPTKSPTRSFGFIVVAPRKDPTEVAEGLDDAFVEGFSLINW